MEKKYCIYCGTENSWQAKFCTHCGKEMNPQENLLIDFLVKRTKDKFKGSAEDSLYEALKNFLLSHLYGVMLTVSFVSALAVTSYASDGYITEMSARDMEVYLASLSGRYEENTVNPVQGEYPTEYNSAVHSLITSYEFETLNTMMIDASGNPVAPNPDKYRMPASMGYGGVHELSPNIVTDVDGLMESGTKNRTEFMPERHTTDIAGRLTADGYTVGECVVETRFEDENGDTVKSYEYMAVAVLVDGQWLIAEDRIIEVYEAGPQPVNYDFDTEAALDVAIAYYEAVLKGDYSRHLLADSLLGYDVQHQLTYDEEMLYNEEGTDVETYYTELIQTYEFTNNISAVLRNEGYNVVEYFFEQMLYDVNNNNQFVGTRDFGITMVEIDGSWYVAEDVVAYRTFS